MSAETDSGIDTAYVELLGEGTFVLRPVQARHICGRVFKILAPPDYDPNLETWRFQPGSLVRCDWEMHEDVKIRVAKEAYNP